MADNEDNTVANKATGTTMVGFSLTKFIGLKPGAKYGTGTWYEIAHNVASMKDKCHKTAVDFTAAQNNKVKSGVSYSVTNTCVQSKPTSTTGAITIENPNDKSKMKVKFSTFSRSSNYWVYDTDYTNYAIVGNGGDNFWIMSRQESVPVCKFNDLLEKCKSIGFDTRLVIIDDGALIPCGGDNNNKGK